MMDKQYYLRVRGKVAGPFGIRQLQSLRDRGQFRRFHEISEDRQTWMTASGLPGMFEGASATMEAVCGASATPGKCPDLWLYADANGKQQGPIPGRQLVSMWQAGTINDATLVWREGLPAWAPIATVGLQRPVTPSVSGRVLASPRRKLMLAAGSLAAAVLLALAGLGLHAVVTRSSHPTQDVSGPTPAAPTRHASAALMASEAKVWTLEGRSLKEAQELLASSEGRAQFATAQSLSPSDKEQRLRQFLRSRRSASTLNDARQFIETLNAKSRRYLSETASRQQMRPEDLVLDWLTYEGALDLGMITRIWHEQGNFKGQAAKVVGSFLEGVSTPPEALKGVEVKILTDNKIVVSLFGAQVVEEVIEDKPAKPDADNITTIYWKSNYNYLREVLKGETPKETIEEKLAKEDGRFTVEYQDLFEEYLTGGHRQQWASDMYEGSALTIAATARDDKVREKLGQKPAADRNRERSSLRDLFAKLAPSVPLVEALGKGWGSGFLVQQSQQYFVVTNRHVIENATAGVAVHFITSARQGQETRHTIPAAQTSVVAIHRNADVAVVDVTPAAGQIRQWGIQPVALVPGTHVPEVGEHVFAIGHPAAGSSGEQLTRTLSDGIVSAVGRKLESATFIQVTVPINPGNSGGPLFDDDGRVVGVNTLSFRKSAQGDLALEALNFSLQISFVQEVLADRSKSFDRAGIDRIVRSSTSLPTHDQETPVLKRLRGRMERAASEGYRPYGGSPEKACKAFEIEAGQEKIFFINVVRGEQYIASIVSEGAGDIDMAVLSSSGTVLAADTEPDAEPIVRFRALTTGRYALVVTNPSRTGGVALLTVLEK